MKKSIVFIFICFQTFAFAQKNCTVSNQTFKAGELFTYKINYNWGAIWVSAGEATFSAELKQINNATVYHFVGWGTTYSKYDFLYKVRDKYESYADTLSLKPLRFIREASEGGSYTFDDYVFSQSKHKVYTNSRRNKKPGTFDSISITACTNDVLTAIYYVRCLDFSRYKVNDTIPVTFVLDGEVFPSYVRYLGKEIIKSELLGQVRCIKFRPKLIEGTLFKGGEEMVVWVTDDENRMPVYVETPILVGTIKVSLLKYSGLRNKLDCVVPK
ncbi:MAG TPA: DUF3108 domain-containing protein [Bacteroidia bacterium]|jgi:hypothetical protein|nr:DUF3108 domain-containing protein [Bacteroidia bacterium]